jgi:hypothetical protein
MPKSVKLDDQFGFRLCDLHSVNDVDLSRAEASVAASDRMRCCETASDVACLERGALPLDVQRAETIMFLCFDFNSKIVEDANQIAIKVGSGKFGQIPRFVIWPRDYLRLCRIPLGELLVHLRLAVEIGPEKDRACVAVVFTERAIGRKQPAVSS